MVEYSKLQNGSDIRGVALPLVAAEPVNLTEEAAGQIGRAFATWLDQILARRGYFQKDGQAPRGCAGVHVL